MSARFGRNKRRAMRQEIATAHAKVDLLDRVIEQDRQLMARQDRKIREADAFLDDVCCMVGREAIISGNPETRENISGELRRFLVPNNRRELAAFSSLTSFPHTQQIRAEVMNLLDVETINDAMRRQSHFRVKIGYDHEAAYAISDSALAHMTQDEIIRQIAPEIARLLARSIKKGGKQ